ncbi:MAG: DUF418 domain-containing protein [Candidatus Eiseniibacteriota bacterium]
MTTAFSLPDSDNRLLSLDILRGIALFGMILVHFHQRMRIEVTGLEDLIGWGVWILVEQKSWGMFALLFGASFAILLRRLEARGDPVLPIYTRRLAALAVFGVVTDVCFGFRILFEYACLGVPLFLVRKWSTRALLVLAAVAACAAPLAAELIAWWAWWTKSAAPEPSARHALAAAVAAATQGQSYLVLLSARCLLFVASLPHTLRDLLPSSNLTLFILGLLAVRHRPFDEPLRHVRTIVGWMIFGAVSWALGWLVLGRLPEVVAPGATWPLQFGLGLVQDQWLTFTYVGAVVLLLAFRPQWIARLAPVGNAGRMALTNYVLQAAVIDFLSSGYGLGLKLRPMIYTIGAAGLCTAIAALSTAWLARHRFGPLEWLWRSLTYARWQPLRREGVVQAPSPHL